MTDRQARRDRRRQRQGKPPRFSTPELVLVAEPWWVRALRTMFTRPKAW